MVPNRSYEDMAFSEATRRLYADFREDPFGWNLSAENAGRQVVANSFVPNLSTPNYEQVADFYNRGAGSTRKPDPPSLMSTPESYTDSYFDRRLISIPPTSAHPGPRLERGNSTHAPPSVCFSNAADPSPTPVSSPKTLLNIALAEYAIAHSAYYLPNEELLQASIDLARLDLLGMKWD